MRIEAMEKQSQYKANSNPIEANVQKAKNERFCVDKEPYDDILLFPRGIYHPQGCLEYCSRGPNANPEGRKMFLLFFFLNPMAGYADKTV